MWRHQYYQEFTMWRQCHFLPTFAQVDLYHFFAQTPVESGDQKLSTEISQICHAKWHNLCPEMAGKLIVKKQRCECKSCVYACWWNWPQQSISSMFTRAFFVQNFGAKAETYLEKAVKKDFRTKNLYVKCWWNWHQVSPYITFRRLFWRLALSSLMESSWAPK
jgi:hypothetical protein